MSRQDIALTSQVRLLTCLHLLGSRLDELLQRLVLDVVGAPLGHGELRKIAAELHLDEYKTVLLPPIPDVLWSTFSFLALPFFFWATAQTQSSTLYTKSGGS